AEHALQLPPPGARHSEPAQARARAAGRPPTRGARSPRRQRASRERVQRRQLPGAELRRRPARPPPRARGGLRRRAHRVLHGGAATGGRRHRPRERQRHQRAPALQEAPAAPRPAPPLAGSGGAEEEQAMPAAAVRDELGRTRGRRVRGELFVAGLAWLVARLGPRIAGLRPPELTEQSSGVDADLRAVMAVSGEAAWASGSGGAWLGTVAGGGTWQAGGVGGGGALDFRSLSAFGAERALLPKPGPPVLLFLTGRRWK